MMEGRKAIVVVNLINAVLALGGAAMVARVDPDGAMHALTLGGLLAATVVSIAFAMIAGKGVCDA